MLVGVPGSGKSTVSEEYARRGYRIHASDALRERLYGSEEIQGKASEVFQVLTREAHADLMAGRSCVIDASNLSRRHRRGLLASLSKYVDRSSCVMVLARPEVCLARNQARQRTVPPEQVYNMLCAFETPYYYEGWDVIKAVYTGEPYVFPRDAAAGFSQDNPHHTMALGAHMDAARDYCLDHGFGPDIVEAAWYHDIGKLNTKRFQNSRGEPTEVAHFYNHENYGAYLYLCEKAAAAQASGEWPRVLYIANLINWHMRPLNAWQRTPVREEKDRRLIGETMFRDVLLLNEADRAAH